MLRWLLIGFACMAGFSCTRPDIGVPYVPVNYQIIVSMPQYSPLLAVGGYVQITGGSRGIIVYRYSPEEFRAFDRHCTFNTEEGCRVYVDDSELFLVCEDCCQSKFFLMDGVKHDGPAPYDLLPYRTQFDGNALWITNY